MDAEREDMKMLPEAQQNMVAHHHEFVELRESAQSIRDSADGPAVDGDDDGDDSAAGADAPAASSTSTNATTTAVAGAGGSAGAGASAGSAMPARSSEASQMVVLPEDATAAEETLFPKGLTDVNEQQVDLRTTNSWLLTLDQVRMQDPTCVDYGQRLTWLCSLLRAGVHPGAGRSVCNQRACAVHPEL